MKVSVIIPNYEDLRIRRAIASVLRQEYRNFELLVIDGGSKNPELRQYYETCGAHQLVMEPDGGIFHALNKGLARATGDVVYLMGADDELSDAGVFGSIVDALKDAPSIDGICIGCEFVNSAGRVIRTWYPRRISRARIKSGILPPHFSLFLRRELYDLVGPFKWEEFGDVACDQVWILDMAILKADLRIEVLPRHHLRMEYGGTSTGSATAIARQFWVVAGYARKRSRDLYFWPLYSPVRTFWKIVQFRLPLR